MKITRISLISILFIFCVIACFSQNRVTLDLEKVTSEELFRQIEQQSGCVIYCIPEQLDSLEFSLTCERELPEIALQKAFEGTPFFVSNYENDYLFVLKNRLLETTLSVNYFGEQEDFFERRIRKIRERREQGRDEPLESVFDDELLNPIEQKATSENRVYNVGDPSHENIPAKVQLTGIITDFKTGEPIVGAVIYLDNQTGATSTDGHGFYTMQLPSGRQRLLIRGLGLKDTQRQVMLYGDGNLDIELEEDIYSLKEVTVVSERLARVQSTKLGVERLQIKDIKNVPTVFGEIDVLRVVMMLPGVKTVGEASSGLNIRGGATDQNLILFNGGTVYNPTHLFGFFSAFNPDLVKDIELYKSSIPAKYGGRISSVLEVNGREGNKKEFTGAISLGLLTSRAVLEGPIGEKTSFILGGRTTYSDWILGLLPEKSGYKDGSAGFYDINAIIDHKFSNHDNLFFSSYYSNDRFSFDAFTHYGYTNANISAKWRHIYNNKLTSNLTTGYDHYSYKNELTENPAESFRLTFGINQAFANLDFTSYNDKHTVDFGMNNVFYVLNPGKNTPVSSESLIRYDLIQEEHALESAIYIADRWEITTQFSLDAGIRYSMFNVLGPRNYHSYLPDELPDETTMISEKQKKGWGSFKTYHAPEFRLSARYLFSSDFSAKVGANTLQQYIHKLSNTSTMSPTDTWKLSDVNIKPQKGMQVAIGLYKNFLDNTIETSIEGYFKTMKNYMDYRSGAKLIMNHHIEREVISTNGRAYGIEIMFKKTQGKLNGWASYAYSRTLLRQDDPRVDRPINNGKWYSADYDKPHEVKMAGNYKFTHRYSISLNCEYSTGRPITLPVSKYQYVGGEFAYYSGRNQYRIPDFFRLDFSVNIEPSHHLALLMHSYISLGVYNLTGKKNAYSIYYVAEKGKIKGYKLAIFGAPIPYVSYNIRF